MIFAPIRSSPSLEIQSISSPGRGGDFIHKGRLFDITYTAILRKVVRKNVHVTIPKGNLGYDQYTVSDTVAVKPTFVAFV